MYPRAESRHIYTALVFSKHTIYCTEYLLQKVPAGRQRHTIVGRSGQPGYVLGLEDNSCSPVRLCRHGRAG
jgi:hypothetical protein